MGCYCGSSAICDLDCGWNIIYAPIRPHIKTILMKRRKTTCQSGRSGTSVKNCYLFYFASLNMGSCGRRVFFCDDIGLLSGCFVVDCLGYVSYLFSRLDIEIFTSCLSSNLLYSFLPIPLSLDQYLHAPSSLLLPTT